MKRVFLGRAPPLTVTVSRVVTESVVVGTIFYYYSPVTVITFVDGTPVVTVSRKIVAIKTVTAEESGRGAGNVGIERWRAVFSALGGGSTGASISAGSAGREYIPSPV